MAGGPASRLARAEVKPQPQTALPDKRLRVILKLDEGEFEIGSIGIQHGAAWRWGIDTVIPMRVIQPEREAEAALGG